MASFFDNVKDRASLARQQTKRFSISSMGSLRWSYKSDRSEGTASTASSIASSETSSIANGIPSASHQPSSLSRGLPVHSSSSSSFGSRAMHSSHGGNGAPRRHGKSPATGPVGSAAGFEPLYMRKLRQDNERRAKIETAQRRADAVIEE